MCTGTFLFQTAFDHEKAKEVGRINPSKGVDPEYDSVLEDLQSLKQELDEYLNSQRKYFGCKVTVYILSCCRNLYECGRFRSLVIVCHFSW